MWRHEAAGLVVPVIQQGYDLAGVRHVLQRRLGNGIRKPTEDVRGNFRPGLVEGGGELPRHHRHAKLNGLRRLQFPQYFRQVVGRQMSQQPGLQLRVHVRDHFRLVFHPKAGDTRDCLRNRAARHEVRQPCGNSIDCGLRVYQEQRGVSARDAFSHSGPLGRRLQTGSKAGVSQRQP